MQNLSSNISTQALFTKGGTFGQRAEEAASNGAQAIVKKLLTSVSITKHCMQSLNAFVSVISITLTSKKRYVDQLSRVQDCSKGYDVN